ncbi:MAG: dihydrolipoyl dehydrogenase [Cryomorphaceae bacterium MED-G14]|nr:MAG: dihydrolipoyl dehydrogenase [Cryomorphaceae bacterium MED-G14]
MDKYDVIVIGSGPGGYVTAIRASQLGFNTAIVEKESLGGVCLNWGCIPTKALLKSAEVYNYLKKSEDYGISAENVSSDFDKVINRSRSVADTMSKGVNFLMKKNKITVIKGHATINSDKTITIQDKIDSYIISGSHVIIATGARSREINSLVQNGKNIIGYREAMTLEKQPKDLIIVGSGAIGVEFAYFYNSLGTNVTLVEYLPKIAPLEDDDISKELQKILKKQGVKIMTSSELIDSEVIKDQVDVKIKDPDGEIINMTADVVLSAVGIKSNIEDLGLENLDIKTEKDKILVDDFYKTNVDGFYAIGDVVQGPALAHVASAEGITCVEKIKGMSVNPLDYGNIPGCTYCKPEIASVGLTEKQAVENGFDIKVGKFPFTASGKAQSSGNSEGFVKVIFDSKYGEWLGCHMIGSNVTEMISEAVVGRKLETTGHEILKAVHPHPTLSEAVMEAVADAYDEVIHL